MTSTSSSQDFDTPQPTSAVVRVSQPARGPSNGCTERKTRALVTYDHPRSPQNWLAKHPRFHLHFIPTSSSWLNMVERWFGKLDDKAIRRGIFKSVPDLIDAIETYLNANNTNPTPFVWTATAQQILTKVRRGRVTHDTINN